MKFEIGKKYRYRKGKTITVLSSMPGTDSIVVSDNDGRIYVLDPNNEREHNWTEEEELVK